MSTLSPAAMISTPNIGAVSRALRSSPYGQLQRLACELRDDQIVLQGTVDSYYLKQLAQEAALKATNDCRICNEVEVRASNPSTSRFDF